MGQHRLTKQAKYLLFFHLKGRTEVETKEVGDFTKYFNSDQLGVEHYEGPMISLKQFDYEPSEHEAEKASNSYLMSLIAVIVGLPLPIINLLATFIFYMGNRKGTYFVRWHCTQALWSQLILLTFNSIGFWWTVDILFKSAAISNDYIAYVMVLVLFNLIEFITTMYTAVKVRKHVHVYWWLFGDITQLICKPSK